MDPLTAFQVAAAAAQFASTAIHIAKRLKDFLDDELELPGLLKDVTHRLGLITSSLEDLSTQLNAHPEDFSPTTLDALRLSIAHIGERCTDLDQILTKYLPSKSSSTKERVQSALKSLGKDERVKEIGLKLEQDIVPLILRQVTTISAGTRRNKAGAQISDHLADRKLHVVPSRHVAKFIKRDEILGDVKAQFFNGENDAILKVMVLQGMGGLGKTQLALEYCKIGRKEDLYAAIFWVDADNEVSAKKSFEEISEVLKYPDQKFTGPDARVSFVKSALTEWQATYLMVFDNYDNPKAFDIRTYFPNSTTGHVLVTSRSPQTSNLGVYREISGMSEKQALDLFYTKADIPRNSDNVVSQVVKRLGLHPLAIDQASVYFREKKDIIPLSSFLDHYEKFSRRILDRSPTFGDYFRQNDGTTVTKTTFTTLNMSYSLLDIETKVGALKASFIDLLAFFDESDISEELFTTYFPTVVEDPAAPDWLLLFADSSSGIKSWERFLFHEVAFELRKLSLISACSVQEDGLIHISLHPIVRDLIKLRQPNDIATSSFQTAARIVATMVTQNSQAIPAHPHYGDWWYLITSAQNASLRCHTSTWLRNFKVYRSKSKLEPIVIDTPTLAAPRCVELILVYFLYGSFIYSDVSDILEWICKHTMVSSEEHVRDIGLWAGDFLVESMVTTSTAEAAWKRGLEHVEFWKSQNLDKRYVETAMYHLFYARSTSVSAQEFKTQVELFEGKCNSFSEEEEWSVAHPAFHIELAMLYATQTNNVSCNEKVREIIVRLYCISERHPKGGPTFRKMAWSYRLWRAAILNIDSFEIKRKLMDELDEGIYKLLRKDHPRRMQQLLMRATLMTEEGEFEEARKLAYEYIKFVKYGKAHLSMALEAWKWYGDIMMLNDSYEEAIGAYQEIMNAAGEDKQWIISALYKQGIAKFKAGDYEGSETAHSMQLRLAELSSSNDDIANALFRGAMAKLISNRREKFQDAYRSLHRLLTKGHDAECELNVGFYFTDKEMLKCVGDYFIFEIVILFLLSARVCEKQGIDMPRMFTAAMAAFAKCDNIKGADRCRIVKNILWFLRRQNCQEIDSAHWISFMENKLITILGSSVPKADDQLLGLLIKKLEIARPKPALEVKFPSVPTQPTTVSIPAAEKKPSKSSKFSKLFSRKRN
ncbi:hypothetical protein ABW20_dc0108433 [Dactylellina cionopaga]|nr:hypothetical protein ABW20_dc0108433 [Dactylellina cionopaga]